jgi:hypothetical protein
MNLIGIWIFGSGSGVFSNYTLIPVLRHVNDYACTYLSQSFTATNRLTKR